MKVYETTDIRNVALLGHAGSGKTLLGETLLYKAVRSTDAEVLKIRTQFLIFMKLNMKEITPSM